MPLAGIFERACQLELIAEVEATVEERVGDVAVPSALDAPSFAMPVRVHVGGQELAPFS